MLALSDGRLGREKNENEKEFSQTTNPERN
jgi:hypothetical protein